MQLRAFGREPLGVLDRAHEVAAQPIAATDDAQAHAVVEAARRLADQVAFQQAHQVRDLLRRPRPVVRRERIESQDVDRSTRGRLDDATHRFGSGAMTCRAGETTAFGPTTVAVHDDRSVHCYFVPFAAWISASMCSRCRANTRLPLAVKLNSVFGTRAEKRFLQRT